MTVLVDVTQNLETARLALMADLGYVARVAVRGRGCMHRRGGHPTLDTAQRMRARLADSARGGPQRRFRVVLHGDHRHPLPDDREEREQIVRGQGQHAGDGAAGADQDQPQRHQPFPFARCPENPHVRLHLVCRRHRTVLGTGCAPIGRNQVNSGTDD